MTDAAAGQTGPLDLLVVASWYPAVDDTTAGRFVADQAEALFESGRARPLVASFEPALLTGAASAKEEQLSALESLAAEAVRGHREVVSARGWGGRDGLGVARLPIATGGLGEGRPDRPDRRRAPVLAALAERLVTDGRAPAVVHAHTCFPDGAAAAEAAERIGRPLVITEHASFVARLLADPETEARYRAAARAAVRFICVSRMLAGEILAVLPELQPKLVVIPNSVAVREFALGDPAGRRPDELLFVGYRKPEKGIEHLLETFARVRARRPGAVLRMIGRSPSDEVEAGWRRRSEELGIADAVRLEPAGDRATVAAAMARAALFVHPSPRETFGVVAVEALCSGLPVVATASGGLDEILGDDPRALGGLVPPGDPNALAAAVLDALDRRETFDPAALRASVERRFGAPVVAARLLGLYEEVLAEAGGAGSSRVMHRAASSASVAAPSSVGAAGRILVLGLNPRRAAKLLGGLPDTLRARLVVVSGRVGDTPPPSGLSRLVLVEGPPEGATTSRTPLARIGRLLRDPVGVLRRRLRGGTSDERRLEDARLAMRAILDDWPAETTGDPAGGSTAGGSMSAANGSTTPTVDLVCLDGIDYLAARPLLADGRLRLAPGGVRWLADRWSSRQAS